MTRPLLIEGHASLFSLADLSGDVVLRGAFADSLRAGKSVPMLFQHDPSEPVGLWTELHEDQRGLFVKGGFRTRRSAPRRPRGRSLIAVDLWEVSIVTFPMLPQARLRLVSDDAVAAARAA